MAAGTAIVASRVSSLPEIVRDGIEGSLILPKDAHALASALIHLANEPELRTRMGEAGRQDEQSYAQEHMLDAHEALPERHCRRAGVTNAVSAKCELVSQAGERSRNPTLRPGSSNCREYLLPAFGPPGLRCAPSRS